MIAARSEHASEPVQAPAAESPNALTLTLGAAWAGVTGAVITTSDASSAIAAAADERAAERVRLRMWLIMSSMPPLLPMDPAFWHGHLRRPTVVGSRSGGCNQSEHGSLAVAADAAGGEEADRRQG